MSNSILVRLGDRVINQPLLLTQTKAEIITSVLSGRIGLDEVTPDTPNASRFEGDPGSHGPLVYRNVDGVALVSIVGSLVNRGAYVGAQSGVLSYEGIKSQIDKALVDEDISSIMLDLQSPGGEAVGCFELAAYIRQASAEKPIHAFVNGMACSAAYAIASGCNHITSIPTGQSGSIGVVLAHVDYSKAVKKAGMKVTFIHAGAHKVDGHPYGPLPASVHDDLQARIFKMYDNFVDHVSTHRSMPPDAVRQTEARVFSGGEALDLGLIDQVGGFDDAIKNLTTKAVSLTAQQKGLSMSKTGGQAGNSGDQVQMTQADLDAKLASAKQEGKQEGLQEGAAAETERVKSILGLEEAKGRTGAALAAIQNGLTVEQAQGMIATSAKDVGAQAQDEEELAAIGAASYEEDRRKAQASAPDLGNGAASSNGQSSASFKDVMSTIIGEG